jgi:acetyl esterase/lipase
MANRSSNPQVHRIVALTAYCIAVSGDCNAATATPEVERFAHSPRLALAALSPDGRTLSYVEHAAEHQIVVLRNLIDDRERRTLSVEPKRERLRWCDWAGPDYVLCGSVLPVRRPDRITQKTRLYAIRAANGDIRELNLRLKDPIRDQVIGASRSEPHRVFVQHDPTGSGYPEVAELDVATSELRRIVRSHPPVRRWMSDRRGRVSLGIGYDGATATLHVRSADERTWSVLVEQMLSDPDAVGPVALGEKDELFVLKHHDGRSALFRLDVRQDAPIPQLVFADPSYDVTGPVALDPASGAPLSVQYVREYEVQHALHESEAQRLEWLNAQLPGAANLIVDRSDDGRRLLVRSGSDVDPPSLYLMDTRGPSLRLIGHSYPSLEGRPLSPMKLVVYPARDGQRIPAYLTLPLKDKEKRLPAIVLPHGGPETRTWRSFDPLAQFLASQGYAVLQMNFRGSFGYGTGFAAAGIGQWGGVIHNDITDGTRWLVEQQIADPTRICIAGLSFGGYAALLGAARESQWYACAASFAGVADLMALAQYTQRLGDAELWKQRLGTDARALWQMSPIARVHAIETPILIVHGRLDPVVPISQARRFARLLRKSGKPYELIERADCDHDMTAESCRIAWFSSLQRFLREAFADADQ